MYTTTSRISFTCVREGEYEHPKECSDICIVSGTSLPRKTQLCCVHFVAVTNMWDILPFYDWIFELVLSYTGTITCKFCAVFLTFKEICTLLPHSKPHFYVMLCTCSDEPL